MAINWDEFTPVESGGVNWDDFEPESGALRRVAGDTGLSLLKGAIAVPEAAVGIADMATGGRAGKLAEEVGFRPQDARAFLDQYYTPQQRAAFREVQEAKGFLPTVGAALKNPSVIGHSVAESLPSVGAGGVIGRALARLGARPLIAGATGEGVVSGGLTAEQVRQESPEGLLTPEQSAIAAGSGALTSLFGAGGGALARKLKIADVDTLVAGGKLPAGASSKGFARRLVEGGVTEGIFEELPQSLQEQLLQNYATGKPLTEGVAEAGAMGMLAGAAMGGGASVLFSGGQEPVPDRALNPRDRGLRDVADIATGAERAKQRAQTAAETPQEAPTEAPATAEAPAAAEVPPSAYARELDALRAMREKQEVTPEDRQFLISGRLARETKQGLSLLPAGRRRLKALETELDRQAHEAATSPQNDRPEPTDGQKEAGNYKMGHIRVGPTDISIENPEGSTRSGVGEDGKPWESTLTLHYGYAKGVPARAPDKERVDFMVVPGTPENFSGPAFIIDQNKADGSFDEPKVVVGAASLEDAKARYLSNYQPGWESRIRGVTQVTIDELNARLNRADAFLAPQPDSQAVRRTDTVNILQEAIAKVGEERFQQHVRDHMEQFAEQDMEPAEEAAEIEGVARNVLDGAYDQPKETTNDQPQQPTEPVSTGEPTEQAQAPGTEVATTTNETVAAESVAPPARALFVEFGGKRFPVQSVLDAQQKWNQFRMRSGGGGSEIGEGVVVKDAAGKAVAKISYNGRMWDPESGAELVRMPGTDELATIPPRDPEEGPPITVDTSTGEVTSRGQPVRIEKPSAKRKLPAERRAEAEARIPGSERESAATSPHFAAGAKAFKDGEQRVLPSYFTDQKGKNAKAWYRGWDAAKQAAPAEQQQAKKAPTWREIGVNGEGNPLFEDARGVRSYTENGARLTETVGMVPGRGGVSVSINKDDRGVRFSTKEELAAKNDKVEFTVQPLRPGAPAETLTVPKTPRKPVTPQVEALPGTAPLGAKPAEQDAEAKAREDLKAALADLGDILGAGTRKNITPEQEQKLLPVMTRLFDAAFRLGHIKFKQAARFVRDQIRSALGADVENLLTVEHYQGWYISMSGRYREQGADKAADVAAVESLDNAPASEVAPTPLAAPQQPEAPQHPMAAAAEALRQAANAIQQAVSPTVDTAVTQAETESEAQDGRLGQQEGLPAGTSAADTGDGGARGGDRQPLDDGLAGPGEGDAQTGDVSGPPEGTSGTGSTDTGESGQQPSRAPRDPATVRREPRSADGVEDFEITDESEIGRGGLSKKYRDNIAAIKAIKAIEAEGRTSNAEERATIAKYVGWGGLKGVFDPQNKQWTKEHAELKALLTPQEWKAALASMRNAHYTSTTVVSSMYQALERMGFRGGRVLEPSVGVGNFFGLMPKGMRGGSSLFGVELDVLTSKIATHLYPNAKITQATGFQDFQIPSGYFDVAIGNPPFGSEQIVDDDRSAYSGFSIHNYFFAKSIDKLRPGGLLAMVVSHNFLDRMNPAVRNWIAQRADLVSAVRLPLTAFKESANTEVVTDIVIFKRVEERPTPKEPWLQTKTITIRNPQTDETAKAEVNRYFIDNPQNVLGTHSAAGSMYRTNEYTVEPNGDLAQQLAAWAQTLPQDAYESIERGPETLDRPDVAIPDGIKVGSFYANEKGAIMQRLPDALGKQDAQVWEAPNATAEKRMRGMMSLRDKLRAQMRLERDPAADERVIEGNRRTLRAAYDAFVKEFGYLNNQTNRRIFMDDPEAPLVQALEVDYDAGLSKTSKAVKEEGAEPREASAKKADIQTRRVLFPPQDAIIVNNAKDALLASLNIKGRLDMDYIRQVYDQPEDHIIEELGDLVYEDPASGYLVADEYLSGDVKTKLDTAVHAAKQDKRFERNVEALKKVIPADLLPSQIYASPGAPWVPRDVYERFLKEISGHSTVSIRYVAPTAQWLVSAPGIADTAKEHSEWGTTKVGATKLFDIMLNGRAPTVHKTIYEDGKERRVVDEQATEQANEKFNKMRAHWESWVWQDGERASRLTGIFNDKHNRTVERSYDGSHMTFPGMSPAMTLRKSQKDVVWRGVQDRVMLMDHVVGAGKTFAGAALAMEMRRLGIARKPIFIVPNHLTLAWRQEFYRLYPAANILAATPEDFSKDNRRRLFSKIVTGNWDAVIIGHSSLKKIGLPAETERRILQEQIDELTQAIEDLKRERGDRHIVRDMEKIKANLEAAMKKRAQQVGKRDDVVSFDELGVDAVFLDEFHEFKNLYFNTQKQRVAGLGNPKGSAKAFDLFVKLRWLVETFGEKAPLVTMTGTPISNSLAEMFTVQRYMQFPQLKRDGLHLFDAWAKTFGDDQAVYEVAPSGVGYRVSTRFAKFKNLPALMSYYRGFADVITLDDLKAHAEAEGKRFPVPKIKGGRPQNVVAKKSPQQNTFIGEPILLTDDAGRPSFKVDPEAEYAIEKSKDGTKWVLQTTAGHQQFETEEDAKLEYVSQVLTPQIGFNEGSLLHRFANLRELMRETKGRVNALSLTNLANKVALDYRLIDPNAGDFEGSKINIAVDNMLRLYKRWSADRGAQLVFSDLSVPLSARSRMSVKEARVYVRDPQTKELTHKRGTLHTVEGYEGFPYYLVGEGKGAGRTYSMFDPVSGAMLRSGFKDKGEAHRFAAEFLKEEKNRERWMDSRDAVPQISEEELEDYKNEHEIDSSDDAAPEISRADLEGVSGATAFSVYDDIKAKLIKGGVKEREIAFIHDFDTPKAKLELFKRVNRGDVRFLLGSTPKMGAGTNVQERLVALHHIDAPWRPSDLEQREGRIVRQGNLLYERDPDGFEIEIQRYATEQTYDTRRWQILEHKAAGVEQMRKYGGELEIEDVASEASNAAEMKAAASGNPLILKETELRNEARRLESLRRAHSDELYNMQRRYRNNTEQIKTYLPRHKKTWEQLRDEVEKHPIPEEGLPDFTVDGKAIADKEKAATALQKAFVQALKSGDETAITYRGLEFTLEVVAGSVYVREGETQSVIGIYDEQGKINKFSPSGLLTRFENFAGRTGQEIAYYERQLEQAKRENEQIKPTLNRPFEHEQALQDTKAEHIKVQRQLMKEDIASAIKPSERAKIETAMAQRKKVLRERGLGQALDEFEGSADEGPRLSRSSFPGAAVSMRDAQAVIANIRRAFPGAPPIHPHETLSQAPTALQQLIRSRNAEADVEAAFHEGEVHVFPANIASVERMEFVVGHHELRHYGLRGLLGPRLDGLMLTIYAGNETVKREANRKIREGLAKSRTEAVEETLADLPVEEMQKLKGFKRLVADIREALRKLAAKLRRMGLESLAKAIEPSAWTDNDVIALVQRAEEVSLRGDVPFRAGGSALMTAYHGSPHEFERFDISKIGTGEGAQAFGHGLYFSSKREVAEHYRDVTTPLGEKSKGRLYQVDLAPAEDEYLLWHKPLSQQSEKVKAALAKGRHKVIAEALDRDWQGTKFYQELAEALGEFGTGQEDASKYLHSLGVPGIKYLDQASRGRGEGSFNYVIFDDSLVEIEARFSRAQTQSPEFRKWFGDSKVVDDQGRPLVVYHGTAFLGKSAFTEFAEGHEGAMFFTADRKTASSFADWIQEGGGGRKKIYRVYLSIKNPKVVAPSEVMPDGSHSMDAMRAAVKAAKAEGYDGMYIPNTPDMDRTADQWVAFKPEQIKSAIGNRGTFDPGDSDIRFSRALTARAREEAGNLFQSQRTFNRWWHRTVGTQFHKAKIDRHFRRVFDLGQDYLTDTSRYAMMAESEAPDLLLRMEGVTDLLKRGIPKGDKAALAQPIFQGTLDEVTYSDAELREDFGLTDQQIEYYQQFRAAVDSSLDELAKSTIAKMAKGIGIRMDSVMQYRDLSLPRFHKEVNDLMRERARMLKDLAEQLDEGDKSKPLRMAQANEAATQARQTVELYNKVQKLKKEGYAPLMRFGEYTVYVTETRDDEDGNASTEQVFFGMYESQREANAAAKALAEEYPEAEITQGVMSKEAWRVFNGLSPDTVEIFAKAAGLDQEPLFQQYLRLAVNNRSALKRLIHRKGVPGFSQDVTRVLASFVTSNARLTSSNYHLGEMQNAVEAIPKEKGDVKDEAVQLWKYLTDPQEEAGKLRGFLFFQFLGGSIASAMVNATQPITMTAPYLTKYASPAKVASELSKAAMEAAKDRPGADVRQVYERAQQDGITAPHEIYQLMAQARGNLMGSTGLGRAMKLWGSFFSLAEAFNRRATFIAAYRIAVENGEANPYDFAREAVYETQGLYNKGNRPDWARGATGATIFTFKQFSIAYVEFLKRLHDTNKPAFWLALAILAMAGGAEGMPFAEDIEDVIDTIGQWLGYTTNSKRWLHRRAAEALGEGGAQFVLHGFSAIPGVPLDVSQRMGMHNLIPGTAALKRSESNKGREALEVLGPIGGVIESGGRALEAAAKGDFWRAGEAVMPLAVRNLLKGAEMWEKGYYTDTRGRRVMDTTEGEAILKAAGFQPARVASESRKMQMARQDIELHRVTEAGIADKWARGVVEKRPELIDEARAELKAWNAQNPDQKIRLIPSQIRRRVVEMRKTREQRFIKTAPPEIRRQVATELR